MKINERPILYLTSICTFDLGHLGIQSKEKKNPNPRITFESKDNDQVL